MNKQILINQRINFYSDTDVYNLAVEAAGECLKKIYKKMVHNCRFYLEGLRVATFNPQTGEDLVPQFLKFHPIGGQEFSTKLLDILHFKDILPKIYEGMDISDEEKEIIRLRLQMEFFQHFNSDLELRIALGEYKQYQVSINN